MEFLVLGAAAGGGLPQWNCGCPNCHDARAGKIPSASQSSLAVSTKIGMWSILNASPDIRIQMQACSVLYPRFLRDTPVHSVLLTNGDIDHIAGLLSLREQTSFLLYATAEILSVLNDNKIFDAVSTEKVSRKSVALGQSFELQPGLQVEVIAVPGKVPLYLEGETVQTDLLGEQTIGVRLSDTRTVAYYIPGCADVTDGLLEQLQDADQLFFDGTLWEDNEMIHAGTGLKTGKRMGHMSISGPQGSIARLAGIKATKTFIHINNTNPIWQPDSPERAYVLENGWTIAADGMSVSL